MNHINWVQQDPDYQTKYHVLKWGSSHFHEPRAHYTINSALQKEGAAFAVSAGQEKSEMPVIGLGQISSVKSGGFALGHGQEGMILQDDAGAEKAQDSVAISAQAVERQSIEADTQTALQQSASQQDMIHQNILLHSVVQGLTIQQAGTQRHGKQYWEESASASERVKTAAVGQGNIRNRLKESAARLQEIYEKQKQRIKKNLFRVKRAEKKPEPQKKPGRTADREQTLSMRAQNHYLLDSYDRNGQYHTLGK